MKKELKPCSKEILKWEIWTKIKDLKDNEALRIEIYPDRVKGTYELKIEKFKEIK